MKLGRANVDALLRSLTAKQFLEWEMYARLEPFAEIQMDYRFASICQVIANVNRGKDQAPFKLEDFRLRWSDEGREGPVKAPAPWERMKSIAMAVAMAHSVQALEKR